jgi:hypothetical protein
MSHDKRVHTIETSLTPKAGVLFWLEDMLQSSHESYLEKLFANPSNPRVIVVKAVGEAVRENLSYPRLTAEQLEQAVREAQRQADTLILLVLNLHERVRSKCQDAVMSIELICEQRQRLFFEATCQNKFEPKDWDSWRDRLFGTLTSMLVLREMVTSISAKYYDGHPLLFAADNDKLNVQIAYLQEALKLYNNLQHVLPGWKPITIDASFIAHHVEALAASLMDLSKVQTFAAFGEDEAARGLADSCRLRSQREMKKLLSSSSTQNATS